MAMTAGTKLGAYELGGLLGAGGMVEGGGAAKVFRVDTTTGKMDFWKAFGTNLPGGVGTPHLPDDTTAYAYGYTQAQTEAYVVKGLK